MKKVILYDKIEDKAVLEKELAHTLTPDEALVHALDLMDFMAALRSPDYKREDDGIDWIILKEKSS